MTILDTNRQARAVALVLAVAGAILSVIGWFEWARVG
jgi:hypothetical protein